MPHRIFDFGLEKKEPAEERKPPKASNRTDKNASVFEERPIVRLYKVRAGEYLLFGTSCRRRLYSLGRLKDRSTFGWVHGLVVSVVFGRCPISLSFTDNWMLLGSRPPGSPTHPGEFCHHFLNFSFLLRLSSFSIMFYTPGIKFTSRQPSLVSVC
jgi:hypothetical protein